MSREEESEKWQKSHFYLNGPLSTPYADTTNKWVKKLFQGYEFNLNKYAWDVTLVRTFQVRILLF